MHGGGLVQHIGCHKRIAVAVAADPVANPQKGRHINPLPRLIGVQLILQRSMKFRHLTQKCIIIIALSIGHFIENGEFVLSQQAGLPERDDNPAQLLNQLGLFLRRLRQVLFAQQGINIHLAGHGAFAPHLGGVGG